MLRGPIEQAPVVLSHLHEALGAFTSGQVSEMPVYRTLGFDFFNWGVCASDHFR
jgi:hypothetical protein